MSTEYRFYCPEQQREVSTTECYDRGNSGRACYGECCDQMERAICMLAQERLRAAFGDRINVTWNETDSTLTLCFHEHLILEAYYDRLFRTVGFDAYLKGMHGHNFPAEDVDGLVRTVGMLLRGDVCFVIRQSWLPVGGSLRLVERAELQANWRRWTRGCRTLIIDGRGVHEKDAFAMPSEII